ncbi:hypothetical protein UFOVP435_63 [uncultured Caudovirales phage]|uniref:Uncharacterized protein n=1 Tax=uncultured Caudovirales phage TaxID=2100421 RepID=A0A6J5M7W9_9CAUD|nr:hypothetical protein UFOVP435_63 [uncultured Caudovirales phage]
MCEIVVYILTTVVSAACLAVVTERKGIYRGAVWVADAIMEDRETSQ